MTNETIINENPEMEIQEENQPVESTEPVATETASPETVLEIPENWEAPVKDFINGIEDVEGKKTFFDKFKNLDSGYQTKYSDLGEQKKQFEKQQKEFEGDKQFLDSYRNFEKGMDVEHKTQIMARHGNMPSYMNSLYNMDIMASKDPSKFLMNYMHNNNITRENLEQILSGQANQQHVQQSNNNDLEKNMMAKMEEKFQAQKAQETVNSFMGAKNEQGELKHPHFETVRNVMANLEGAYPDKSLEELYDMAVYADPTIRESLMTPQVQAQAKNLTTQNEVKKARSVQGAKATVGAKNLTENKGWQQVLTDSVEI